ncbi:hypothetical protein Micbo1qcDRAFT_224643 [Microdochium bolleyi]|uniref:Lysine-2,3-aminomutase C-terminal domain-containing protein n=1 Tax=Microdochium bolleyi TaxID=196109 RepID=A0A136J5P3_9PEZI|nr:hypothetical protein Micbo1qcDRAFT_224643 [Microdochium bolleyi]
MLTTSGMRARAPFAWNMITQNAQPKDFSRPVLPTYRQLPGSSCSPPSSSQYYRRVVSKQQRYITTSAQQSSVAAAAAVPAVPSHSESWPSIPAPHTLPYPGIYHQDRTEPEFWRRIPRWENMTAAEFGSFSWSNKARVKNDNHRRKALHIIYDATNRDLNIIQNSVQYSSYSFTEKDGTKIFGFKGNLEQHLREVLPAYVPPSIHTPTPTTREDFIQDVLEGAANASMSVRVTAYIWSLIDWNDPANDPLFKQFVPLRSFTVEDHPALRLDSLEEKKDSPVDGLVHRYPNKALFLVTDVCPLYCGHCTRAYTVSEATMAVAQKASTKPKLERIKDALAYIEKTPELVDIVVSGGDMYMVAPALLEYICDRLTAMPSIKRFRIASKGLNAAPHRIFDRDDEWTGALLRAGDKARRAGKDMALHTHYCHPNEITWMSRKAASRLHAAGLTVRNQAVLLRGVNDTVETQARLIEELVDMRIQPYYVYQCDMSQGLERFRTPLQTILDIQKRIRGSTAGFAIPQFVVDLPGGGGKRLACDFEDYDRESGVSTWTAPAVTGRDKAGKIFKYHDPVREPPPRSPVLD